MLAIIGLESRYIHEVIDILARASFPVGAFVPSRFDTMVTEQLPTPTPLAAWSAAHRGGRFTIPLLTPGRRKRTELEALEAGLTASEPIIDPTATVSPTTKLGEGSVVNALAAIGAWCSIGRQAHINRTASLGHDLTFGDYVTIGPNATLCGGCELAPGVFVGAGATLAPKVKIGANSIIGAGAVVISDIPAHTIAVGNPAKVVREGIAGYRDIGV